VQPSVRERDEHEVDVVHGTTVGLNAVLTGEVARNGGVAQNCIDAASLIQHRIYGKSNFRREFEFQLWCQKSANVPPVAVDAGQGQQGRFVFTITPELGANNRSAVITTNFPMAHDKPIDVGITDFCKDCKICADNCPGNAITFADEPNQVERGYERWALDVEACYNFWGVVLGNGGCRICLAGCPYSRKDNWIHSTARTLRMNDPTGLTVLGMIWMQETFFDGPDNEEYYPPNHLQGNGTNASYRNGPEWMRIEEWFNVDVTW